MNELQTKIMDWNNFRQKFLVNTIHINIIFSDFETKLALVNVCFHSAMQRNETSLSISRVGSL